MKYRKRETGGEAVKIGAQPAQGETRIAKPVSWLSCTRAMPRARLHVCLCRDGRDLELATGEIGASGAFSAGLPSGT